MKDIIFDKIVSSREETYQIARNFSKELLGDETIFLFGEAGAGKTVFTKGLAVGLGISEEILSPTYSLVNIYEQEKKLVHFDMYRIENEEECYEAGLFEMLYGDGVKVVEWSENVFDFVEKDNYFIVSIQYMKEEGVRKISIYKESK